MRVTLNLLSEKRKKKIMKARILRFVIWQEFLIMFVAAVFLLMLFSINFILAINLNETKKEIEKYSSKSEFQEIKKHEDNFSEINKKINLVSSIQKNDYYWTNFFHELSRITPQKIKISNLSTDELKASLSGRSENRNVLIEFRDKLEESQCFFDVEVPPSNVVKKEDIDFKIDLKINRDCLKLPSI